MWCQSTNCSHLRHDDGLLDQLIGPLVVLTDLYITAPWQPLTWSATWWEPLIPFIPYWFLFSTFGFPYWNCWSTRRSLQFCEYHANNSQYGNSTKIYPEWATRMTLCYRILCTVLWYNNTCNWKSVFVISETKTAVVTWDLFMCSSMLAQQESCLQARSCV